MNVFPRAHDGDEVSFPRNNVEKCGNVISRSHTLEQASESAEKAVAGIVLRLQTGSFETDLFLSGRELASEKGFPPSCYDAAKFEDELSAFEKKNPVLKKDKSLQFPKKRRLLGMFLGYNFSRDDQKYATNTGTN